MEVQPGDTLFTYVYLNNDPQYRPETLILQWHDGTSWAHRAYWGRNVKDLTEVNIPATDGTEAWRYMGEVPPSGQWVRLEIPASYVGLEGKSVRGMAFGVFKQLGKARANWDYSGKTSNPPNGSVIPWHATVPLWRYYCPSDGFYYLHTSKDWNAGVGNCSKVLTGYIYNHQAPGTVPLREFQSPDRWFYTTCATCTFQFWTFTRNAGYVYSNSGQAETVPLNGHFRSSDNNYYFTTYPNPPDTNPPPSGFPFNFICAYVHPSQAQSFVDSKKVEKPKSSQKVTMPKK
jgi:hypothetical protein